MLRLNIFLTFILCISFVVFGYVYYITNTFPKNFPVGTSFVVGENESLRSVSLRLEKDGYIYSALWFRVWISSLGKDRHIQLGSYQFNEPYALGAIVKKFISDVPDKPLIQVTIPEGSTSNEIANLVSRVLPNISSDEFLKKVLRYNADGKLFPSTYFLLPSYTSDDVVKLMMETFEKKYIATFKWTVISEPLKSVEEVVSLAAILEGEAKTEEDMKIVAGILLNRLKSGMRLQVDVDKETYISKGLPSTPINNPGLMSLSAVLNPTESSYLFYITDNDGIMHYAKTFSEHKINIKKYLK